MEAFYGFLETGFEWLISYAILLIEFIGVAVLMISVIRGVVGLFTRKKHVRLELAEGIALSLEFKMGGELLRTVSVRDWNELLILGAVILLRAALTFLIHWEIGLETRKTEGPASDPMKK
ncbi:MAG: DUF1622 domain-containing protein [Clostridia bacterium]|nr:DUF1622 domain-containing protein [Clostridia bacterium]MBQ4193228.1 DUF1622 domain-containing protein [Clostridia bacterium]MBQ4350292.1 DUF1622 domain-containing protein [Clostridia bacterium]